MKNATKKRKREPAKKQRSNAPKMKREGTITLTPLHYSSTGVKNYLCQKGDKDSAERDSR